MLTICNQINELFTCLNWTCLVCKLTFRTEIATITGLQQRILQFY